MSVANRLDELFARKRREGAAAFIAYLCAGDPDLPASGQAARALLAAGADILELGVPFTDPVADGPTIQQASARALAAGTTLEGVLELAAGLRRDSPAPLLLMSSLNPLLVWPPEGLAGRARAAGVDGFIIPDLPLEESAPWREALAAAGLHLVPLVAPTTPPERRRLIVEGAGGFIYYVSLAGVTGARSSLPEGLAAALAALRSETARPVAVGFGVSQPEQVRALARQADGVIVGSALVARLAQEYAQGGDWRGRLRDFAANLARETRAAGQEEEPK